MKERSVSQSIRQQQVVCTIASASAYQAACIMTKARCGSVLVMDETDRLIGIVTERDLMTKVVAQAQDPVKTLVQQIMTPKPHVVSPNTSVSDAVLLMKRHGFRHLPIVDAHQKIVGVFSIRDAFPEEVLEADVLEQHIDQQSTDVLS